MNDSHNCGRYHLKDHEELRSLKFLVSLRRLDVSSSSTSKNERENAFHKSISWQEEFERRSNFRCHEILGSNQRPNDSSLIQIQHQSPRVFTMTDNEIEALNQQKKKNENEEQFDKYVHELDKETKIESTSSKLPILLNDSSEAGVTSLKNAVKSVSLSVTKKTSSHLKNIGSYFSSSSSSSSLSLLSSADSSATVLSTWSAQQEKMRRRIERENPSRRLHIMALVPDSLSASGNVNHEQKLTAIQVNKNGHMIITPDLSMNMQEEKIESSSVSSSQLNDLFPLEECEDEEGYDDSSTQDQQHNRGKNQDRSLLMTHQFKTAKSGILYEYCVQRIVPPREKNTSRRSPEESLGSSTSRRDRILGKKIRLAYDNFEKISRSSSRTSLSSRLDRKNQDHARSDHRKTHGTTEINTTAAHNASTSSMNNNISNPLVHLFCEIQSVTNFNNAINNFILARSPGLAFLEYEIILPPGWSLSSSSSSTATATAAAFHSGISDQDYNTPLKGCTHYIGPVFNPRGVRRPVVDAIYPRGGFGFRTLLFGENGEKKAQFYFEPGLWLLVVGFLGLLCLFSEMVLIPSLSYVIINIAPSFLTYFIGVGGIYENEVMAIPNNNNRRNAITINPDNTAKSDRQKKCHSEKRSPEHTKYHFNFPIQLHLQPPTFQNETSHQHSESRSSLSTINTNEQDQELLDQNDKVTIIFQVWSRRSPHYSTVEGCGYFQIPLSNMANKNSTDNVTRNPGSSSSSWSSSYDLNVSTWKYVSSHPNIISHTTPQQQEGNIRQRMREHYFGNCSSHLQFLRRLLLKSNLENREIEEEFAHVCSKMVTETSGDVQVKVNMINNCTPTLDSERIPEDTNTAAAATSSSAIENEPRTPSLKQKQATKNNVNAQKNLSTLEKKVRFHDRHSMASSEVLDDENENEFQVDDVLCRVRKHRRERRIHELYRMEQHQQQQERNNLPSSTIATTTTAFSDAA